MRRFRPRYSLLVLMLLVACAAIFMQVWIVATETDPTNRTVRTLRYGWASGRRSAARALGDLGMQAGPSALPALLDAVADRDESVRFEAVGALGRLGAVPERTTPRLIAALKDPSRRVRRVAAEVLGQVFPAPRAAIPGLIDCLDDPDATTRATVVTALGRIGMDPAANTLTALPADSSGPEAKRLAPLLIAAMRDPDATVRAAAVVSLVEVHPPAAVLGPRLAEALNDRAEAVRRSAVRTLSGPTNRIDFGVKDVGPALLALFRSGEPPGREAVIPALTKLLRRPRPRRDPDLPAFAPMLVRDVVAYWSHDPTRFRNRNAPELASEMIGIIPPDRVGHGAEAREMVLGFLAERMLRDSDASIRARAAGALVWPLVEPIHQLDLSSAWRAFLQTVNDPDLEIRHLAAVAIRTFAAATWKARCELKGVSRRAEGLGREILAGHWVAAYFLVGQLRKELASFGRLRNVVPFAVLPDLEMVLRAQLGDRFWSNRLEAFRSLASFRAFRPEDSGLRLAMREATRSFCQEMRRNKDEASRAACVRVLLEADPRDSDLILDAIGALRSDPSVFIQARLSELSERFGDEPVPEPTDDRGPPPDSEVNPRVVRPPSPAPRSGATRSEAGASLPGRS